MRALRKSPDREGDRNFTAPVDAPAVLEGAVKLCTVAITTNVDKSSIAPTEAKITNRATLDPDDPAP